MLSNHIIRITLNVVPRNFNSSCTDFKTLYNCANKIEELMQLDFKSLYNCANKIEEVMQFIYYDITKHNRSIFL